MIKTKYGFYPESQFSEVKKYLRKQIFYLLLYVDPKTKVDYPDVNVPQAIIGLQYKFKGLNSILLESPSVINVMSMLEAALLEFQSDNDFDFYTYRKLILDAGNEVLKIDDSKTNIAQVKAICKKVEKSYMKEV